MNDMTNELAYMGNAMVKAEHAWKPGECWFFDRKDEHVSANATGGWEHATFNGREIHRFVIVNAWD